MIKFIHEVPIKESFTDKIEPDEFQFLDLTGRRAYWSQGFYGQGEVAAVVDTGVSPHEEFGDRLLPGRNFTKDFGGDPDNTTDVMGHGTHCAGTIAGKNVGMAPKAEILPIKVLGGTRGEGTWDDIIAGLEYLKVWRHPKTNQKVSVVSMSLSSDGRGISSSQIQRLNQAVQDLVDMDIAIFCSMGNTGGYSLRYPASLDPVIAVGAVDIEKKAAYFTTTGDHVDICSIGVNVLSACHKGGYCKMSGTSMSTPMSAGNALQIANKYKETFDKRIKEPLLYDLVKFNTKDLGIKGVDKTHGAGFFTLQPLEVELWMMNNEKNVVVNGETIEMETPAKIEEGRFLIPIRYIADPTGAYVKWDPEQKSATVRY